MPLINKLPQRVNKWLQDGKKLGLISDKQQLDFISKYVSLRLSGTPVLKRKAKTMVEDQIDKVIDNLIPKYNTFEIDVLVNDIKRDVKYVSITPSMIYHRIQKRVDAGKLDKVGVEGTKKVIYALKKTLNQ
tara:strand:+ start:102 stop:494 length:393 start_codon:yes stop_codon:yes gene_type:complete